jgi:tetratricopeptide (TPR) repeat protein
LFGGGQAVVVTREMVEDAFRNGRAATTVLLAAHWLRDHPNDLGIALDYAEMLYKMTRYEDAIRAYEEALTRIDDDRRWAYAASSRLMYAAPYRTRL